MQELILFLKKFKEKIQIQNQRKHRYVHTRRGKHKAEQQNKTNKECLIFCSSYKKKKKKRRD